MSGETVLKFDVILENAPGCELSRERCEVKRVHRNMGEFDVSDQVDKLATAVIEGWVLSLGDTITIVEVD